MEPLKYFKTRKGQQHLAWKRKISRLQFFITQKLKTKDTQKNKIASSLHFQQEIVRVLEKRRRRAFRSPVIVEIAFSFNQDNPPSIHKLAKHYLDLLENPLEKLNTHRKKLMYNDDRLIKVLIVHYVSGAESKVSIKIDRLSNFIADLELVERIRNNDFENFENKESFNSYRNEGFDHKQFMGDCPEAFDDHYDDSSCLVNSGITGEFHRRLLGEESYEQHKYVYIKDIQLDFLQKSELRLSRLLLLYSHLFSKEKPEGQEIISQINEFNRKNRDLIISKPFAIHLPHTPCQSGEKKVFKQVVKEVVDDLRQNYPFLFPLLNLLSITILYIPPETQGIDLDNLARYIIPIISEAMKPPKAPHQKFKKEEQEYSNSAIRDSKGTKLSPQYYISKYQVLELPRFEGDSDKGYVRLILGSGLSFDSLWDSTNRIIKQWDQFCDKIG